jgi:hypothetical protein
MVARVNNITIVFLVTFATMVTRVVIAHWLLWLREHVRSILLSISSLPFVIIQSPILFIYVKYLVNVFSSQM